MKMGGVKMKCPACGKEVVVDPSDPFCPYCGYNFGPLLKTGGSTAPPSGPSKVGKLYVIKKDNEKELICEITETRRNLGREELGNYAYRDPGTISRSSKPHFFVWKEGDNYYIEDDQSTNGTYIEGQNIKGKGKVELNDNTEIILVNPANPVIKLLFKIE
jgi:hypothetical protein